MRFSERSRKEEAMRFSAVHDCVRPAAARAARPFPVTPSPATPARALALAACALAACALALAACGSVTAPGGTPGAPTSPARTGAATTAPSGSATAACTPSQLAVGMTHTGALGGQAGGYLRFTNDGATACQMNGWPAVVALTASGHSTTLKHAQSTMYGAWQAPTRLPVVRLAPGGSAYAVVAADDQAAGNGACPAPYVRLRVGPPGSPAGQVVSAWLPGAGSYLPACTSATGAPTGEISAITPLAALPH
jgi:Protein of unknown function (DUF4232)